MAETKLTLTYSPFTFEWNKRYMKLAKEVSTWSKDPSSKIGAVAIGNKGQVLAQGYNGFPRGIGDDGDRLEDRDKKYSYIVQGDQVKWIYLKPNPYRIEALAFLSYEMPPQIKTNLFDKYVDKNKVYESVLKNKIEGFYSDLGWVLEDKKEDKAFSLFFAKDLAS